MSKKYTEPMLLDGWRLMADGANYRDLSQIYGISETSALREFYWSPWKAWTVRRSYIFKTMQYAGSIAHISTASTTNEERLREEIFKTKKQIARLEHQLKTARNGISKLEEQLRVLCQSTPF